MVDVEMKLLADCSEHIPTLAQLYFDHLGKHWVPGASVDRTIQNFQTHLNRNDLPLTYVACHEEKPIAMASLRTTDGIRPDLTPWLGSLVVDAAYRRQGIGETMIEQIKSQAKKFGFQQIYLFAFEPAVAEWYRKLGWQMVGEDTFHHHPVTIMNFVLSHS